MPSVSVRQLIQAAKSRKENEDEGKFLENSFVQKPQRSPLVDGQLIRRNVLASQEGLDRFEVPGSPRGVYVIDDIVLPEVAAELADAIQALPHYKQLRGARRTLPLRIGVGEGEGLVDHLAEELLASLPQLAELFGGSPALNHALVNDYERGCGGIMPHTDGPAYYPVVMIVCLVSATVMQFGKTPGDVETQVLLPARSLLIFTGEAYNEYLHSIPFHDTQVDELATERRDLGESVIVDGLLHRGPRLSITLRRALVPFEQLAHIDIAVRSESRSSGESVQEELLDDDEMVEAIVYIEPARHSVLLERLQSGRRKTLTNFGPDPSYFFGLHSSATGFFRATRAELRDFVAELTMALNSPRNMKSCDAEAAQELMKMGRRDSRDSNFGSICGSVSSDNIDESTTRSNSSSFSTAAAAGVQMGDLIVSHDGCVLLSMKYDEILAAVKECASQIRSDTLRFKRCSHMTLAKNREGKGGEEVLGLYQNEIGCDIEELQDKTVWDLIVYEKTFHSESLEEHGPHDFQEIARIPLGQGIKESKE